MTPKQLCFADDMKTENIFTNLHFFVEIKFLGDWSTFIGSMFREGGCSQNLILCRVKLVEK